MADDIFSRYQQGLSYGRGIRAENEQRQNQSRLSELAQAAYGSQDDAGRQAAIGEAIGINPQAGFQLNEGLQGIQDQRTKSVVQAARLLSSAPPESQAGLYTNIRSRLASQFPDMQLPDSYTPEAQQYVQAINRTYGGPAGENKVVGNALVGPNGEVVYQGRQFFQTDSGLIEVGPQGAREVTLGENGQPVPQVESIGQVQPGTGFNIDPSIPPQVAAQITQQETNAGGMQRPWTANTPDPYGGNQSAPGGATDGRILPRGAGADAERLNLARDAAARSAEASRLAQQAAADKAQFGTIPAGFRINADRTGLEAVPGGPKPAGATASEDERKAAGWFNQAQRARANIAEVLRQNPGADRPGEYEAYGFRGDAEGGPVDRYLAAQYQAQISPERQRYNQAISSFGEAVLRAATGAGVNRDEAAQKVRELTPVPGDSAQVRAQKLAGLDGYLGDLQTRAGRALNPANQQPTQAAQAAPQAAPQRARNPQTGQVIELRNGQWVPVDG